MEQNREPRNKLLMSILTKEARTYTGVRTVYSINGVWKIGQITCKKNETRLPFYTIYKNKLNMD